MSSWENRDGISLRSIGVTVISENSGVVERTQAVLQLRSAGKASSGALLILNADDWGQDVLTTNRILDCSVQGAISSVSAMVFMEDSERAADLAKQREIETGLHLNFTTPFSQSGCSASLREHQLRVAHYLHRHRLAQIVFHPGVVRSFEYLVTAQLDEFRRIYGTYPERLDGHHHMHLCANVLLQRLLPARTLIRRNFSFERGEKSIWNRLFRKTLDNRLARRHRLVDYFFSLPPFDPPERLRRIYRLAEQFVVEVETHPINPTEYTYLTGGEMFRQTRNVRLGPPSSISWHVQGTERHCV